MKKRYRYKRLRNSDAYFPYDEEDYPIDMIEEELENDGINSKEEGFWIGYTRA